MRFAAFSLVEVMVVVAMVGVMTALAVPNISAVVSRERRIADLDLIRQTLSDARNEARLRRVCVNVASPDLVSGVGTSLRVAVDVNCNGTYTDSGDVIRSAVVIGQVAFPDSTAGEGITFSGRGGLATASPTQIRGTAANIVRLFRVLPAIGAVRVEK